ncbi:MAG: HNH endonuclease [Anaerolineales bacterium]|nr:HNH endonuclease [Anaerolineales bacterium]
MPISIAQRQHIATRANFRCEYCLLSQEHSIKKHEPDHIIPRKHGGEDVDDNLAWSCFHCNRYKGSEVGAYDIETGQLMPLFNPRKQNWYEHFVIESGKILARTSIGRVTILILQLNRPNRIEVRKILQQTKQYP